LVDYTMGCNSVVFLLHLGAIPKSLPPQSPSPFERKRGKEENLGDTPILPRKDRQSRLVGTELPLIRVLR